MRYHFYITFRLNVFLYTKNALNPLFYWCLKNSDITYISIWENNMLSGKYSKKKSSISGAEIKYFYSTYCLVL